MEPKNSLEALDNLVHCKSETKCKECRHKNVCTLERDYNIVKQDLALLEKFKNKVDIIHKFGKFLYEPTDNKDLIKVFLQVPIFNANPNVDRPTTNFIKVEIGLVTKEEFEVLINVD